MKNHFKVRKEKYFERHALLISKYVAEASRASNRARFIMETILKQISIMDLKKKAAIDLLAKKEFDSDPVKAWAAKMKRERGIEVGEESVEEITEPGRDFDYILNMPIFSFTKERKEALLKERDDLNQLVKKLKEKTPLDLWRDDLEQFSQVLDEVEKEEKELSAVDYTKQNSKNKKAKGKCFEPSPFSELLNPDVEETLRRKTVVPKEPKTPKEPKAPKEPKSPKVKKEPKDPTKPKRTPKKKSDDDESPKKKKGKNPWETDSDESEPDLDDESFGDDDDEDHEEVIPTKKSSRRGGVKTEANESMETNGDEVKSEPADESLPDDEVKTEADTKTENISDEEETIKTAEKPKPSLKGLAKPNGTPKKTPVKKPKEPKTPKKTPIKRKPAKKADTWDSDEKSDANSEDEKPKKKISKKANDKTADQLFDDLATPLKKSDNEDSEDEPFTPLSSRATPRTKTANDVKSKYKFSDSESD